MQHVLEAERLKRTHRMNFWWRFVVISVLGTATSAALLWQMLTR